ncbi:hypothetical protein SAMN05216436_11774 [bacterium A37T11]|nr:hypothetical protein SAMN05216436_11774 [bacterium A37T11]
MKTPKKIIRKTGPFGKVNKGEKQDPEVEKTDPLYDDEEEDGFELDSLDNIDDFDNFDEDEDY